MSCASISLTTQGTRHHDTIHGVKRASARCCEALTQELEERDHLCCMMHRRKEKENQSLILSNRERKDTASVSDSPGHMFGRGRASASTQLRPHQRSARREKKADKETPPTPKLNYPTHRTSYLQPRPRLRREIRMKYERNKHLFRIILSRATLVPCLDSRW